MSVLTVAQLKRQYGIKPSLVTALANAGVIQPELGPRGAYALGFQDIVLLRSAAALGAANVKPAHLTRFLKALRAKLPPSAPLSSVRIALVGRELVVRIDDHYENASGQLVLDFASMRGERSAQVIAATPDREPDAPVDSIAARLADAAMLEAEDAAKAVAAYRDILDLDPACVDAAMNLIVLLLESGRAAGALKVARAALEHHPDDALLRFNLGVVCEELERFDEALLSYQYALQQDPQLADAHFNVAQIHHARGERRDALRHLAAYRRLHRG